LNRCPKIIVGILGGIASGKSLVAACLNKLGAVVFPADQVGHAVLEQPEVKAELRQAWGDAVFHPDGAVDRQALARIVFGQISDGGSAEALARLEAITHPRIEEAFHRQLADWRQNEAAPVFVVDAAVMDRRGWQKLCDHLLFVDAPPERRLSRAQQRGWTADQFANRESHQMSLEHKRAIADTVVDNSGTPEATELQIERWWRLHVQEECG